LYNLFALNASPFEEKVFSRGFLATDEHGQWAIINSKSEIRNPKQIPMTKARRRNHKLQTTNYKQFTKDKEQKNKQKNLSRFSCVSRACFCFEF